MSFVATWGYDRLRPLQEEAIRAGLERRDSLVVLPTGGGKSLDRLDRVLRHFETG